MAGTTLGARSVWATEWNGWLMHRFRCKCSDTYVSAARRASFAGALDDAGWGAWQMQLRGESESGNGEQVG